MYADYPYIISLSGYNKLLEAAGVSKIFLEKGREGVGMEGKFGRGGKRENMEELQG